MGEELKKPYEISIWENQLVTIEGDKKYYKENKIAVIGSDTMTAPNRVYSPVFKKNINGEKTLTFSLAYKYYDEAVGDFVVNPFIKYLINERVVKLKYDNEWYEFVIKECEENSESHEFTYTAIDMFIQELAKTGYNISFSTELNNNLGTVTELAETILKDSDWQVDKENSDILKQTVTDPIYVCTVGNNGFEAKNLSTNEIENIAGNETIYVFYTYIANKTTTYVQFLRQTDNLDWIYDDNNAIIGTNYRILTDVSYDETNNEIIIKEQNAKIIIGNINMLHQGHRLVYNQKTTYDPVMGRTVNEYIADYEGNNQRVYEYDDYVYTSSAVVLPVITNGSNFNVYEKGSLVGWDNTNYMSGNKLPSYNLVTFPKLKQGINLAALNDLKKIRGYLEFDFTHAASDENNNYANSFFNSGFTDNASIVEHLSKGEKYVFRIRYETSITPSDDGQLSHVDAAAASVRAIIAKYKLVSQTLEDGTVIEVRQVDKDNIYLHFNGAFSVGNNIITGGEIKNNNYIIDNVIQTPSFKYLYKDKETGIEYVWNGDTNTYDQYDENTYSNYFYTIAEAQRSVSRDEITDINNRFGIFIYDDSNDSKYAYIEEIEIFKYVDSNNETHEPVMPGNAPEAKSNLVQTFYLKPESGMTKDQINTYNDIENLASDLGMSADKIVALRNENCEKILSIEEQQSNCFNLLQSLCETFKCWLDIRVEHDEIGAVKLDDNYKPIKKVAFKEFIGKDNFAGFKYGINLKSIQKNIDSNEFVTKLIVGEPANEYTDSGTLSITDAISNQSKESYIINLNYYLKQGLIENKNDCLADINSFNINLAQLNKTIKELNTGYIQASGALNSATANRNVFVELYETAAIEYNKALEEFHTAVGMSYETYRQTEDADPSILENQTVADIISRIYSSATTLNSYAGLVTSIKNEYNNLDLLVNGAQTYNVIVSTVVGEDDQESYTKLTLSHYIEGFECIFTNDVSAPEVFKSKVNQKEFTSNIIYNSVSIRKIPEHYNIEVTVNGETRIYTEPEIVSFNIYEEGSNGLSRRFRLIPAEDYEAANRGYKKQIKEAEEQKQNFVNDFNSKYSRFIQEGTWESNNYIDPELYYLDAVEVSNVSAQPKVSYTIEVAEISEIEGFENYNFDIGDKTYIEDTEFFGTEDKDIAGVTFKTPIKEEVVVSEVEWHLDEPWNNTIVIQNYKTQFEDLFQRISAAVQSLNYNQASYTRAASILDVNGRIRAEILSKSLNAIAGEQSYSLIGNGIIQVVEDGILVQDLTSAKNSLIIKSGGISLSTDGGITWTQALSPEGFNADVINAGTINTSQIMILDGDNPTFRWDRTGLNAYGYGDYGYDLNTYVRFDKYGLYGVKNGEGYVCTSLDDVKDKAHFGVTWDGFFIKNSYTNGYVSITSDNDFQVVRNINGIELEKIKIGALDFNSLGNPMKYGIRIRNDAGAVVMETGDDGNLTVTGTINAAAGNIGGMSVNGSQLKMDTIVLEPGVGIYSTIQTLANRTPIYEQQWIAPEEEGEEGQYITVLAGYEETYEPNFIISDVNGNAVFNQIKARGEINATSGNFTGGVTVGKTEDNESPYIIIDGDNASIKTSSFGDAGTGWMINGEGDAVFNNITARGAIKTAVFEYAEIQAVGGLFIFRPSSTIRTAKLVQTPHYTLTADEEIDEEKTYYIYDSELEIYTEVEVPDISDIETYYELSYSSDLVVTVEKPLLFKTGQWCKVSNYIEQGQEAIDSQSILLNNGLSHVYEIEKNTDNNEITLLGAGIMVDGAEAVVESVEDLVGGALVDMGNAANGYGQTGTNNYGIGINSSDNTVNLPARAISLFETIIDKNATTKVSYDYKGILGTLPQLPVTDVEDRIYNRYMAGTQGIYTDNMYLGDNGQYIAFYTDNNDNKQLTIKAHQIMFEVTDEEGHGTGEYKNVTEAKDGENAIDVRIDSNLGNFILSTDTTITLTSTVYSGANDITNQVSEFAWTKYNQDGTIDENWVPTLASIDGRSILVDASDIQAKAIFICTVNF